MSWKSEMTDTILRLERRLSGEIESRKHLEDCLQALGIVTIVARYLSGEGLERIVCVNPRLGSRTEELEQKIASLEKHLGIRSVPVDAIPAHLKYIKDILVGNDGTIPLKEKK